MGAQDDVNSSSEAQVTPNEKIAVVTESDEAGFNKFELHIDDEAGEIVAQALASGPADAERSKKVLRKIDMYILPFLCVTYGTFSSPFQELPLTFDQDCSFLTRQLLATPPSSESSQTTT